MKNTVSFLSILMYNDMQYHLFESVQIWIFIKITFLGIIYEQLIMSSSSKYAEKSNIYVKTKYTAVSVCSKSSKHENKKQIKK